MTAFTASTSRRRWVLLGLAVLGEMGTAVPRVVSSTRWRWRAVAVSTNSLLACTIPAPDAWLRAHQDVGIRDFCRCAHGQRVEEKGNNQVQTLRLNHGTTDIHSTEEDTKMEHSESIYTESRSSQRTLTRVPKVTTESYPW